MKWYVFKKKFLTNEVGTKVQMLEADAKGLVDGGTLELVPEVEDPISLATAKVFGEVMTKVNDLVTATIEKATKSVKDAPGITIKDRANEENSFGYESLGMFGIDVMNSNRKSAPVVSDQLSKLIKFQNSAEQGEHKTATGLSTQRGEDAGILIPPNLSENIYRKTFPDSTILSEVDTYNIDGNQMVFPRLKEDSRATGSRFGGIRSYWVAEGDTVTATKPGFDRLSLTLKKMMALVYVTDELLQDTGLALDQFLTNGVSDEIRFCVTDAIVNGNGVGKPLGILTHASRVTQAAVSGQGANTIVGANVSNMWSRMPASYRAMAKWFFNVECEPQFDAFALSIGTGGSTYPMYLQEGGLTGEAPARLKGRPAIPSEFFPGLGTEGDLTLWVPKSYCFITKGGIKTSMSMHLRFDYDEMVFKFTYRCDGQPWWPTALTPYKGTKTLSPCVTLNSTRT